MNRLKVTLALLALTIILPGHSFAQIRDGKPLVRHRRDTKQDKWEAFKSQVDKLKESLIKAENAANQVTDNTFVILRTTPHSSELDEKIAGIRRALAESKELIYAFKDKLYDVRLPSEPPTNVPTYLDEVKMVRFRQVTTELDKSWYELQGKVLEESQIVDEMLQQFEHLKKQIKAYRKLHKILLEKEAAPKTASMMLRNASDCARFMVLFVSFTTIPYWLVDMGGFEAIKAKGIAGIESILRFVGNNLPSFETSASTQVARSTSSPASTMSSPMPDKSFELDLTSVLLLLSLLICCCVGGYCIWRKLGPRKIATKGATRKTRVRGKESK